MSHVTLYTISVLPPRKFGGFHDRVTVDWSTKLTVKFCGADGGSTNKKNKNIVIHNIILLLLATAVSRTSKF